MAKLPGEVMRDAFLASRMSSPGRLAPVGYPDPTDMVLDVDDAADGVQLTLTGSTVHRVTFEAAADNSGAVLVQRGVGPAWSTPPAFDAAAFSVLPGLHFSVAGSVEQWWVKAPLDTDVVHVTGKRAP